MKYLQILIVLCYSCTINSQVTLAKIFSDNMVLQRNTAIPIWGWAKANDLIEVHFNQQTKKVYTDANGKWTVYLNPEVAGGPFDLTVKGENTLNVTNILVGEVWLCSGQSNMELMVGQSDHAKEEIENASNYPNIRHIKIPKEINSLLNSDISSGVWEVCSSETVADFTGVGYFFAKQLYDHLKIPVGLINASWGGSIVETWMSRESFENSDEFKELISTMPKVHLDTLSNYKIEASIKKIEALQQSKFSTAKVETYKELSLDDRSWRTMNTPEIWELQELGEFDGVVWLRKHISLSKDEVNNDMLLEIPGVDDADITYVNGVEVGRTEGWDVKRNYHIKASILKEGDNVISVRVTDSSASGGIHGDAEHFKLTIGEKITPLKGNWKYKVESIYDGVNFNDYPSLCYNAMINPLIPFAFKGVLWYQGESNIGRAFEYQKTFPMLINDWREKWGKGEFPFYYVQLATFISEGNSNVGSSWAEVREAQTNTLQVPNTGMVVTTDVGNPHDIHPTNKQTVGARLASIAFNNLYEKPMVCSGPMFKSMEIVKNIVVVEFDSIGGDLFLNKLEPAIYGFEIAGNNQHFYPAKATIEDNKVIVFSKKVRNPKAVRFSWNGDASKSNLFNKEGFPAVPFRTDDWKSSTEEVKYKF